MRWSFVLVLAVANAAYAEDMLTFGADGPLTNDEVRLVRSALSSGWIDFCSLIRKRTPVPTLVRTNLALARVAIVRGPYPTTAEVRWFEGEDTPYIYIFLDEFVKYDEVNRGRVVAHEFCHFYLGLPDHHRPGQAKHPECVMDNFFKNGWTGNLCPECRLKVDKFYHDHPNSR